VINRLFQSFQNALVRWENRFSAYQLTLKAGIALVLLTVISLSVFWIFIDFSITRARNVRSELFDRDLRDLANHFDSDERFTLERNIDSLLGANRAITPLILPRQYYVALPPPHSKITPRQPPRNCFVELIPENLASATEEQTKLCSYLVENRAFGDYLFFNIEAIDNSIVAVKQGDVKLAGDSYKLSLKLNGTTVAWHFSLQVPSQHNPNRFEITAFRVSPTGVVERDRRLEGWAFARRQNAGDQKLNMLLRLDVSRSLLSNKPLADAASWPPEDIRSAQIGLTRLDYSQAKTEAQVISFLKTGKASHSLSSLGNGIFNAHASLDVQIKQEKFQTSTIRHVLPMTGAIISKSSIPISWADGDVLLHFNQLVRSQAIADTNLSLSVTHPGVVIESGVWRVSVLLLLLVIGAVFAIYYFFSKLLVPIFKLSKHARKLINAGSEKAFFPYAERKDEVGFLSSSFNELISKIREHVGREIHEKARRETLENARRAAAVRNREENLNIIGHEIRSPLQALISLHPPESESRRYLDRISSALPHLQQGLAAEDAISARKLDLERTDLVRFLQDIARNAERANIRNVLFESGIEAVFCSVDVEALEDVIDNILRNADRHRFPSTKIHMTLWRVDEFVVIRIMNAGALIPSDILEKIFNYRFSTARTTNNGGGEGLGLWVAKRYVEKMKGTITAINLLEKEVCFEIRLPEVLPVIDAA
jgi:signal transduction histidine kinase